MNNKKYSIFILIFILIFFVNKNIYSMCSGYHKAKKCLKPKWAGICKKKKHKIKCIYIKIWLPTGIVYPIAETLIPTNNSFGATTLDSYVKGNAIIRKISPNWAITVLYGFIPCKGGCKLSGASLSAYDSRLDPTWKLNKQILHLLKDINYQNIPNLGLNSRIDERVFATSLIYLVRAVSSASSSYSSLKMSTSPFTKKCYPVSTSSLEILAQAASGSTYSNLGDFLNKFKNSTLNQFSLEYLKLYTKCKKAISYKHRPVYFIWQKYKCCVKGKYIP